MFLRGSVGPAPSGLVLLTQMVAPHGSPTAPGLGPPWTTHKDLSTHVQSRVLHYAGCRRSWALLPRGQPGDGSRGWVADSGLGDDTALHAKRKRLDPPRTSGRMEARSLGGAKPLRDAPLSVQARCWEWGL